MKMNTTKFIYLIISPFVILASDVFATSAGPVGFNDTICYQENASADTGVHLGEIKGSRIYSFLTKIGWTSASGEVTFHCGGSLVSTKFVLTVAHCMDYERPNYKSQPDTVRVAEKFNGIVVTVEDIPIYRIYSHPLYGHHSMYDDIAIIELSEPSKHQPACIWMGSALPATDLFALGHDLENVGYQQAMSLKHVQTSECDNLYSSSRKLPNGIISNQICAGKSNITEREKCKGYIGGPLLAQLTENPNHVYIIGITNFGQRCSSPGFPNIYTKLSPYKDWIDEIVNEK